MNGGQLDAFIDDPGQFIFSLFTESSFGGPVFWNDFWTAFMLVFLILDVILFVAFVYAFFASLKYRPHIHPSHGKVKKTFTLRDALLKERWNKIELRFKGGGADGMKIAVIDADKLVDDVLKQLGFKGEHMADRLEKITSNDVKSLDRLWHAHRMRNNLVHSPDFQLTTKQAEDALNAYEAFLKEVKVLQ